MIEQEEVSATDRWLGERVALNSDQGGNNDTDEQSALARLIAAWGFASPGCME
jgi:hypothetical protein